MKMHDMTKYRTKNKTRQRREIITHSRKWQESEFQIWQVTCGVLHTYTHTLASCASVPTAHTLDTSFSPSPSPHPNNDSRRVTTRSDRNLSIGFSLEHCVSVPRSVAPRYVDFSRAHSCSDDDAEPSVPRFYRPHVIVFTLFSIN